MFSARPLVSTALLALVASTSANPFHFAIEEYRAPWNNEYSPEMVECDLKGVAFGSGYKPLLKLIEGDSDPCVYEFLPGWPMKAGGSIGKTLRSAGPIDNGPGSEAAILEQIQELHAHQKDVQGRDWIVAQAHQGEWLSRSKGYKGMKGMFEQARLNCRAFYESVYTAVYLDAKRYISNYGCIHRRNTWMAEPDVLIEFDANGPTAHLIHWAGADCSQGNKQAAVANARLLCGDYATSTASPMDDCGGEFTHYQAYEFCIRLNL